MNTKCFLLFDIIFHSFILILGVAWLYLAWNGLSESLVYIVLGGSFVIEAVVRFGFLIKSNLNT
ncbi:hypothetical protein [Alkalibacillus almallahensis]|uniref:hypothetical protein n=1 Tax=Alkalibacillus almallahensis TaxID=1379154 RepID=UPI0014240681|nr:hypothetical protein [Alkalibacillus almallahensis]NIK12901.1 hypothetical protein [Alkalibacillus almallahensis]